MSIKNNILWSAVDRFSTQGVQFVLSIIIARLVLPSEYGLVAMLTIFMAVAQTFIDSGFSYALMQKKEREECDFSTVFIINVVLSILVYSFFFFTAPFVAVFYEEPRMTLICRISFIVLIIDGFSIIQRTKLILLGTFKVITKISLISVISSGIIGIGLAYKGYGVWALVSQTIISSIINCVLLWYWGVGVKRLEFSKESFRDLFRFGSKVLCTSLLDTIYTNLYNLVIGKVYKPTELGYYNRAYTLSQFPSRNIYNICSRVIFPKLSEIQNEGKDHVDFFCRYIRFLCFIIFPLMIGLSILSKPLIIVILSEKWLPCANYISILAIAYMFFPLMNAHFDFVNSLGYSNYTLQAEVIKKICGLLILFITLPRGVEILCYGLVFANIMDITIMVWFAQKVSSYNYIRLMKEITPILLVTLSMGILVHIASNYIVSNILKLIIGTGLGFVYYLGISYMLKFKELQIIKI